MAIKIWLYAILAKFPVTTGVSLLWTLMLIVNLFMQEEVQHIIPINDATQLVVQFINRLTSLSIPLCLTCEVSLKTYSKTMIKWGIFALTGLVLGLYTIDNLVWKQWGIQDMQIRQEFLIILALVIVALTFIPFMSFSLREFWVANNIMLIKLLKTVSYCLFILLALNSVLFTYDWLTHIKIPVWVYQMGFILIWCGFGSLYFLSQMPVFIKKEESNLPFPKFYMMFSSMYLLPLSVTMIVCMYIYIGSLLIKNIWPPMQIQILFVVSTMIIICLIFQFELVSAKFKHKLITIFLKYIYVSIVPLAILFLIQILYLWNTQGITEFWYLVCVYISWIIVICSYFAISQTRDIRMIPICLSIVLLMLLMEPLRPYTISVNSQYKKLIQDLRKNELINADNKIILDTTQHITIQDEDLMKKRIYFLYKHNKLSLLKKHYPYPIDNQAITTQRVFQDLDLDG